ncbi:hypothetical protein [Streptomyces xanthophaeus]
MERLLLVGGQWGTILTAGISASVTLVGAVIAYRAGRRQVKDQGEISHLHWLRMQREQAYIDYLGACERANDAIYKCSLMLDQAITRLGSPRPALSREEESAAIGVDEAFDLVDAAQQPLNRIIMLGPDSVADEAEKVKEALWHYAMDTRQVVRKLAQEDVSQREVDLAGEKLNDVYVARDKFTKLARQVLAGEST